MGNQVNNCFLLCLIYIFSSEIAFKKNLEDEHTLLLQLKNPKPNKKQQYEKNSILVTFKDNKKNQMQQCLKTITPCWAKITSGSQAYRTEKNSGSSLSEDERAKIR